MTTDLPLTQRLRRVSRYFTQPLTAWVATVVSVIVVSLTEPLVPALLKPLLDKGFQQNGLALWTIPVALIGLFGVRGLCAFTGQVALAKVANFGLMKLRIAMFERLLDAHPKLYREQNASSLGNTLVYEVQSGAYLLVNSLLSVARDSLTLVALIGYLLFLNWKLSLIVALLLPSVALLMKTVSQRLYGLTKRNQDATDSLAYVVEENALAYREIRLQGAQTHQLERFSSLSQSLNRLAMKATTAGSALTPLTQLMSAAALSAVISVALIQSNDTGTTVGEFAAFVTAMLMLVAPIKHLSEIASAVTRGLAAIERGIELIEHTDCENNGRYQPASKAQGRITFEQIKVQYSDDAKAALKDINLHIQAGESVAFVGSSGAGKTTLVNLLPRFVDVTSGVVKLDDVDIAQWNLHALRQQIAMVSQNVVVLNDTLAQNVSLGQVLDEQRVIDCLKAAYLGDYLQELDEGIHTVVGHNASQLSGGQRQRLAIARALYKDAPILILDEATSALDNESERAVQLALAELQKGRTTLIIAHRLSTIEHVDRIVVMDAGQIVEQGDHRGLLARQGVYAGLFALGEFSGR
jgi:ATP-binding cassette, subfamily B, bacterial MsbA